MTAVPHRQPATLAPVNSHNPGMGKPITEDDMLRVLWRHFTAQGWFPVPQVSTADESEHELADGRVIAFNGLRRIDLLLVRNPRKQGIGPIETLAIEVKVSKEDWRRDLDNPGKQRAWREVAHRHAYAVPTGLVYPDSVPAGSGLITVTFNGSHGYGSTEWARKAPYPENLGPGLMPATIRTMFARLAQLEGKSRGWGVSDTLAGDPEELRVALLAANKTAERAVRGLSRAESQRDAWQALYAVTHPKGAPCKWCGEPVKPLNPHAGWWKKWRHVKAAADEACLAHENADAAMAAQVKYDAADAAERGRQMRQAVWRHSTIGPKCPGPAALDAEPWRAFDTGERKGPYPVDALEGDE